jgi:hypothetical protein
MFSMALSIWLLLKYILRVRVLEESVDEEDAVDAVRDTDDAEPDLED